MKFFAVPINRDGECSLPCEMQYIFQRDYLFILNWVNEIFILLKRGLCVFICRCLRVADYLLPDFLPAFEEWHNTRSLI